MTASGPAQPQASGSRLVVLASRNDGKVAELRRILAAAGADITLLSIAVAEDRAGVAIPEVPETGATFQENALLKATAVATVSGLPAIADDSGLCVDALNGMPGVLSARWSGTADSGKSRDDANLDLVLAQVADVPDERRGAAFVCAAAFVDPAVPGHEVVVEGRVVGRLLRKRRGTNGFGYDPIFVPDGYDTTTAEMTPEDKDAISHRGRAFRQLAAEL